MAVREPEVGASICHASLGPEEYEPLLEAHGFAVRAHTVDDPACGEHTVWLATLGATTAV